MRRLGILAEGCLVGEVGIAARAVGDEDKIELAALGGAREILVMVEIMPASASASGWSQAET
jgi:hypothetical protein